MACVTWQLPSVLHSYSAVTCVLWQLASGKAILHCGDMRYCPAMQEYPQAYLATLSLLALRLSFHAFLPLLNRSSLA